MYHFYAPWFVLMLPLPFLVRWLFSAPLQANNGPEIYFPYLDRLKTAFAFSGKIDTSSGLFFWFCLLIAWLFFVLALMQPERQEHYIEDKSQGYDLMLAVDISASMQALDFSTKSKQLSRLDVTKQVVGQFVKERQGDRVGLVTFGENAYLHVPLTLDTDAVSKMLNYTVSGMAGNATAIGDAIGISVKTLRERPEGSRVLVLLTDGEDNSSSIPPLEAAKLAKHYGIKIYTIGVGKNGVVPFPNGLGGYQNVNVSIDEELLKEIAAVTGGQFFLATDQKALQAIYENINQLEKTKANQNIFLIREPLYYYPLAIAMTLIFMITLFQLIKKGESLNGI